MKDWNEMSYDEIEKAQESLIEVGACFIMLKWLATRMEEGHDMLRSAAASFVREADGITMLDLNPMFEKLGPATHTPLLEISAAHKIGYDTLNDADWPQASLAEIYKRARAMGVPNDFILMLR